MPPVFPRQVCRSGSPIIGGGGSLLLLLALASPTPAQTTPPAAPTFAKPPYAIDFRAVHAHASGSLRRITFEQFLLTYGGELTARADRAVGDLGSQRFDLSGGVRLHEADTTLTADTFSFDAADGLGTGQDILLTQPPFTVRAAQIGLTRNAVTLEKADLTTAPPDVSADYSVRIGSATVNPQNRRGVLRNATLYLFHTRLFTIRRLPFTLAGSGRAVRRQQLGPAFGVSGRYGTYLIFDGDADRPAPYHYTLLLPTRQKLEARVTSTQTLLSRPTAGPPAPPPPAPNDYLALIRRLATAPKPPLPPGDPLLFHNFLPQPGPIRLFDAPSRGGLSVGEELSYHLQAYGRRRDDLYVTRLPEVSLSGSLPLTPVPTEPAPGDPVAFRRFLRHLVIYGDARVDYGYYREQPTDVNVRRAQLSLGLSTRPLLVAPDTVLLPRLTRVTNGYSGHKGAYQYDQASVALEHYFSDRTFVGAQFLASNVRGDSPFSFDVLDTSRELDLRAQVGNRRLAIGFQTRLDLSQHGVIDYSAAVAPTLRGFTPIFFYNFRSRSLGLGLAIPGLTF